ncbi:hypothetical protein ARMSODRAFT_972131 [Armillaria solidipes]|uniref:Uncharacterized protein n=1 Tax=Armillaria solidipes TaxID=1076256 RepID=A0A2H3C601_9AGAR|nr:hypothetical protein ARMSODRAFT_972131 [Armillaria solidipes]
MAWHHGSGLKFQKGDTETKVGTIVTAGMQSRSVERQEIVCGKEKREFLGPYLPEYHRVKAVAKQRPRLFAQFQSCLWLAWSKHWLLELWAPDPEDADAVHHWNCCRQRDLLIIIRTLVLWEPFYAEGHKKKQAGPAELYSICVCSEDSAQLSGMRQSDRVPKPMKRPDGTS